MTRDKVVAWLASALAALGVAVTVAVVFSAPSWFAAGLAAITFYLNRIDDRLRGVR
jgi:energy-coupling factor transporter transmembrane protein EcfT